MAKDDGRQGGIAAMRPRVSKGMPQRIAATRPWTLKGVATDSRASRALGTRRAGRLEPPEHARCACVTRLQRRPGRVCGLPQDTLCRSEKALSPCG